MKVLLVVLFAAASCNSLLAQQWSLGYVVKVDRDTVRGLLVNNTDAELGSRVFFRSGDSTNVTRHFLPSSLLGFGFDNGRTFRRFYRTGSQGGDSVFVFAKKELEGRITMYTHSRPKRDHPDIVLVNNATGQMVYVNAPEKITATDSRGAVRTGESAKHLGLLRIVKGDSVFSPDGRQKPRYSESAIRKEIMRHNEGFKADYPPWRHQQRVVRTYSLVVGTRISGANPGDVDFRVAFYRNKFFHETSREVSFIRGVSYRYAAGKSESIGSTISRPYKQEIISLIPVGINAQTDLKRINPFVYIGVGIGVMWERDDDLFVFPTINAGAGVKVKLGSKALIAEFSPTGNGAGSFVNIGWSF